VTSLYKHNKDDITDVAYSSVRSGTTWKASLYAFVVNFRIKRRYSAVLLAIKQDLFQNYLECTRNEARRLENQSRRRK